MWKFGGIWLATLALAAGGLAEKPHPRLWLPKSSEAALREKLARDPLAAKLQAVTMDEAERVLKKRTCRYEIPDGKRLLFESRIALHNIMHCGWAWRMGGGEKFRLRAIAELEAASTHFMATLHSQIQRQTAAPAPYPSPARRHQEDYGMPVPSPLGDDRPDLHGI